MGPSSPSSGGAHTPQFIPGPEPSAVTVAGPVQSATAVHPDPSSLPTTAGVAPASALTIDTPPSVRTARPGPLRSHRSGSDFLVADTGDAPVGSIESGTDAARGPHRRRAGAWWGALSLSTGAVLAVGIGTATWIRSAPASAPVSVPAAVVDAPPLVRGPEPLPESLWQLARVNEPDDARVSPYAERHRLLDALAASVDAGRIDIRRNLALDLRQAEQADEPCVVFAAALARVERASDAYFAPALQAASVPRTGPGCDGLTARLEAVLATLRGDVPPDGAQEAPTQPDSPVHKKAKPRPRKTTPVQPSSRPSSRPASGLRPFGG